MGLTPILNSGQTFVQNTESKEWTIVHGRGCKPSVSVKVWTDRTGIRRLEDILPHDIQYIDDNTVKVIFVSAAYSGEVRIQ